jgi:hypothetical protein
MAYDRGWYERNSERHIARTTAARQSNPERYSAYRAAGVRRNRIFLRNYLASRPCVDCGESDAIVLEFDHVRGSKSFNVSRGASDGMSIRKLSAEIKKCDVRCANCHKRRHKGEFWYVGD